MKYISEDENHINAECDQCGKTLVVPKNTCSETGSGYNVKPRVRCKCGSVSEFILKDDSIKTRIASSHSPKCPTCGSEDIQKISGASKVGKAVLFGVLAVGAISKTFKCNNCGYQW